MIIETERLILCQLTPSDAEFIYELLNTPTWIKYIGDRGIKNIEDAQNYIINGPAKSYQDDGFGLWLTKLKTDETPIGICGLLKRETLEDIDIGFAFLPEYTGQGYAFEAASATLNYGYTNLNLKRIVAITIKENLHSIKLLEKIGLRFEKNIFLPGDKEELMLFGN